MVKHIVLWNLQEGVTHDDLVQLKKGIEEIGKKLPEVVSLTYHIEKLDTCSSEVMLESTHNSYEDLKSYLDNPLHKEFGLKNRKYITNRHSFDFEY